jgi:hypothetical protein
MNGIFSVQMAAILATASLFAESIVHSQETVRRIFSVIVSVDKKEHAWAKQAKRALECTECPRKTVCDSWKKINKSQPQLQ